MQNAQLHSRRTGEKTDGRERANKKKRKKKKVDICLTKRDFAVHTTAYVKTARQPF